MVKVGSQDWLSRSVFKIVIKIVVITSTSGLSSFYFRQKSLFLGHFLDCIRELGMLSQKLFPKVTFM